MRRAPALDDPRAFLRALFDAAVESADPRGRMAAYLPAPPRGRTVVLGAGKAAAAMARAVEDAWAGPIGGLVVTRRGQKIPTQRIEVVEASHPVPDSAGEAAARRILELAAELGPDDLALCLLSGGGSSLLALPGPGLDLADKQRINRALLASGATITDMNCVRRHLSAIKGGRLALACGPARVVTLAISDIPGDDPAAIASGPTVADPTTCADALAILARCGIDIPPAARRRLESGEAETPKPGDPRLAGCEFHLLATPQGALDAAAARAAAAGVQAYILGDAIEGEAREVGTAFGGIALAVAARGQPFAAPCVLLSGGETTVTVRGNPTGRGGRNVEFLLGLGRTLRGAPGIHAFAADTDGVDGGAEVAGAHLGPDTPARAAAAGLTFADALANHDGHGFFGTLGDAVVTGPTGTNVNDFRAILVT